MQINTIREIKDKKASVFSFRAIPYGHKSYTHHGARMLGLALNQENQLKTMFTTQGLDIYSKSFQYSLATIDDEKYATKNHIVFITKPSGMTLQSSVKGDRWC